jgi:hypothetical protein
MIPTRPGDSPPEPIREVTREVPREVPVRPRELDAVRHIDPTAAVAVSAPSPPAPPATARAAEHTADGPVLCPKCRYDLRGRPGGTRCPECGTAIPSRHRLALRPGERRNARDALFGAWYGLSSASLASAFMISPFPFILPLGVALAVCAGFAPAFRLFALRALWELPGPIREPVAPLLARFRLLERIELGFAAVIAVGALLATFGILGSACVPYYFVGLVLWWAVALTALSTQVRLGDLLSRLMVDAEVLPTEVPPRIIRWARWTLAAGALGVLLAAYSVFATRIAFSLPGADAASALSGIVFLAACAIHVVCALHARAHAILVANCIYESEHFRTNPNRRVPTADLDEIPNALPASKRHSFTPKGDDGPIKLPGE